MDSELSFPSRDVVKCCDFGCDYPIGACSSDSWTRTVKRKFNKEGNNTMLLLRGSSDSSSNAKLLVENECAALLEDLSSQRKTVKELDLELEEERNAAASAANETMSMILRLQREKAEIQMEARQFKAFAEEKMTHDQEKVKVLEELLYEKEQAIEVLSYEVDAYKDMLLSYGITEAEMHDQILGFGRDSSTVGIDLYPCEYTLKCSVDDENPGGADGNVEVVEKVMVGQSPRWPYYDPNSPLGAAKEIKRTCFADSPMSCSSDRDYTIDSIHDDEPSKIIKGKLNGDHWTSPRYQEPVVMTQQGVNEPIEKLYTRLQALEADRESLRHTIVSMRTDKAQLVLLKEIAQHLSKDTVATNRRNLASKIPSFKAFCVVTFFKWIVSFVSWRRKAKQKNEQYGDAYASR
ncbi:unnamed protein product [Eruca vesicaria subsp. sativa]|uniref:GTD-binding domain-containing protein n=1 Tax=Eruca vesicaria subsp. sativa TaxID=29727 RepID=A0ABC8JDX9_ERUVS|nr:unnamed protein product [Eruca vesicaria subsp. sativa]